MNESTKKEDQLRVGLVTSEWEPYLEGGLGIHVRELTAAMGRRIHLDVILPRASGYHCRPNVNLHPIDMSVVYGHVQSWVDFGHAAAKYVSEVGLDVDILHAHDWSAAPAGAFLKESLHRPLVFTDHLPQGVGPRRPLEDQGLLAADAVIVPSQATAAEIAARKLVLKRLEVVPNGVDPDVYRPALDWPADDGYALFVGRLVVQKGVDCLLKAFAAVIGRLPSARLVLVGDGDLELYLKRVARYLGVAHRVEFRGWQTGADLVAMYQHAAVVVVPSFYEPFGIVALEAMACARPIIASRVGGLAEIVNDGEQGYLVPLGDHLRLASRLVKLLTDPVQRQSMGLAARAQVGSFTWAAVADQTLALYRSVIECHNSTSIERSQ